MKCLCVWWICFHYDRFDPFWDTTRVERVCVARFKRRLYGSFLWPPFRLFGCVWSNIFYIRERTDVSCQYDTKMISICLEFLPTLQAAEDVWELCDETLSCSVQLVSLNNDLLLLLEAKKFRFEDDSELGDLDWRRLIREKTIFANYETCGNLLSQIFSLPGNNPHPVRQGARQSNGQFVRKRDYCSSEAFFSLFREIPWSIQLVCGSGSIYFLDC